MGRRHHRQADHAGRAATSSGEAHAAASILVALVGGTAVFGALAVRTSRNRVVS